MFTLISGPSGLPNFTPKLFVNLPEMHMLCWLLDIFWILPPLASKIKWSVPKRILEKVTDTLFSYKLLEKLQFRKSYKDTKFW